MGTESCQQAQHAKLYSDLLQGEKEVTIDSPGLQPAGGGGWGVLHFCVRGSPWRAYGLGRGGSGIGGESSWFFGCFVLLVFFAFLFFSVLFFSPTDQSHEPLSLKALSAIGTLISSFACLWLHGCSASGSSGWLGGWSVGWVVGGLLGQMADLLIGSICWSISWFDWSVARSVTGWLVGWLVGWLDINK